MTPPAFFAANIPPLALLLLLRRHGIQHPYWAWRQARAEGLGLPLACALLIEETGGGRMVYGHDEDRYGRCPGWGWGAVTQTNYAAFKRLRNLEYRTNGVGGMQLTSQALQDEADQLGGCWRIRCNYTVGFRYTAKQLRHLGLIPGIASYNGIGPTARTYALRVIKIAHELAAAGVPGPVGII